MNQILSNKTCGEIFAPVFKCAIESADIVKSWDLGFLCANAEKIWLGACLAAMSRPGPEYVELVAHNMDFVALQYGLKWTRIETSVGPEFWLYRDEGVNLINRMVEIVSTENCPEWHLIRGLLCGIPPEHIDYTFHMRKGYGRRVDQKE